ncbi:MAG: DUF1329 domain-containing protein, partial [Proteobacteria bacterium]|nr:DUF1329 domain-containing protein [Pseudomonadota bacterium]
MHKRLSISLLGALVAAMGSATAADYGPEALGQELTPMGAIKAGNEAGTIPPWSGKWQGPPP